ncbi:MAG: hypothetical protein NTW65_08555 [Deltaproteobacteria bacterium]|nr:hypothetical protein [Deltaproteobacteria bacterium]
MPGAVPIEEVLDSGFVGLWKPLAGVVLGNNFGGPERRFALWLRAERSGAAQAEERLLTFGEEGG